MRSLRRARKRWNFSAKNISPAIVSDMDEYPKQNRFRMRNEVGLISDFYKSTNQDYIVHCEVREGKAVLVNLDISVRIRNRRKSCAITGRIEAKRFMLM